MKKVISMVAGSLVLAGSAVALAPADSASGAGCTWYVYETTKNTIYWENAWGSDWNRGAWQHVLKGTLLKTNDPFSGKSRTQIKYQEWYDLPWQKLSLTKKFPYINKGAVDYKFCY